MSSLSACAGGISSACPPVRDYNRITLNRAATELTLLPAGSALAQMMIDYKVMRDQARACASAKR